ncbi:MAG: hypothetical protein VKN13_07180 [Cyanobacteriota bacterium]|nr:hypothetical protein [Cyanobacteriota bacterium]
MRDCILHVGMPKTGTSSIQEYLYYSLDDPRFRYIGFGEVNGSQALSTICLLQPETYWMHRRNRVPPRRAAWLKARYIKHLRRSLERARRCGQAPILSGEGCWHLQVSELQILHKLLSESKYNIKVFAYVRPFLSWLESSFQQTVKLGISRNNPFAPRADQRDYRQADYMATLDRLASVFGQSQLTIRPFIRHALTDGCAVRDFCAWAGIDSQKISVPRSNDSLSLDAVRFFYAYLSLSNNGQPATMRETSALVHCLQSLGGKKLRFHPSVMAPFAEFVEQQRVAIRERFGVDLGHDWAVDEGADNVIRSEKDLFQFSPESLAWLEAQSGCEPIHGQGETAARQVAAAMHDLRRKALRRYWRPLAKERLRRELARRRY